MCFFEALNHFISWAGVSKYNSTKYGNTKSQFFELIYMVCVVSCASFLFYKFKNCK